MHRLHRFAIRHPRRVILVSGIVMAMLAPGLRRLELRTDGHALAPPGSPAVLFDQSVREDFGLGDPLVVLVRSRSTGGVFDPIVLRRVRELTEALQALPGVDPDKVISLATEKGDRFHPGTLRFRRFLDPMPETGSEVQSLREDLRALEIFDGTLVSRDGTSTALFLEVPVDRDRGEWIERVADLATSDSDSDSIEVHVIGAPVAEALLGTHILADLGIPIGARRVGLLPLALFLMALVFLVSFRSFPAVLLPFSEVGACLLAVFGAMGWLGVPVYLTTAVLPVILTAIAVADEVHIFSRYRQIRREMPDEPPSTWVRASMDEMVRPVFMTSLTTAAGFLSFALSPVVPVRAFGLFAAVGILFCLLWSVTVIPALLTLAGTRGIAPSPGSRPTPRIDRFARLVIRRRAVIIVSFAVLVALSAEGIRRLAVQDSWIDGFSPQSEFRQVTQYFDRQFLGTHVLRVVLETDSLAIRGEISGADLDAHGFQIASAGVADPDRLRGCFLRIARREPEGVAKPAPSGPRPIRDWRSRIEDVTRDGERLLLTMPRLDGSARAFLAPADDEPLVVEIEARPFRSPEVLQEVRRFETFVEGQGQWSVGGVLGPGKFLETTRFIIKGRAPGSRRIPDDPREIRHLWHNYGVVRGEHRLREVVDTEFRRAIVTVYLEGANYADTAGLMEDVRDYASRHLAPIGVRIRFAGDVAVSQSVIEAIVTTQVRSLLFSVGVILVIASLLTRSLRWGLLSVLPCVLAVATIFGVMGALKIPLGIATSMFAGMTLGVGVDFAIHLVDRFRRAAQRGLPTEAAISEALRVVGPANLVDGIAVALGFGLLLLSSVPANARLGGLTMVCVVSCLFTTLALLPALIAATGGIRADKVRADKVRADVGAG